MSARDDVIFLIDKFLSIWKESNFNYFLEKRKHIRELESLSTYFSRKVIDSHFLNVRRLVNQKEPLDSPNRYNKENLEHLSYMCDVSVDDLKNSLENYLKGLSDAKSLYDTITTRLLSMRVSDAENFLNNYLDKEVKSRKLTFINSIETAGGDMVRIIDLSIGSDNMLNGIVSCTNADVKVETVGAGGYNIQRFHYRLLCHTLKYRVNTNIENDLKIFVAPEKKSEKELKELEIADYIFKQANRLELKKNKDGKSRGKDLWDKINDYGYLNLILESNYKKYLDFTSYPIYIKDLDDNRYFIWCMAFAYTLQKDESLPVRKRLSLLWNIEGTDSMERIVTIMNRFKFTEFELFVPLMAKRGSFVRYGEKSASDVKVDETESKINSLISLDESPDDFLKLNTSCEYEFNIKKSFRDRVGELEGYADFRGVKVWERMKEFGYDKKLLDMGYKVYLNTKLYPYFYKDYPEYRVVLGMTMGYLVTDYQTDRINYNSIYYLVKGGDSKISDFERLYNKHKLDEFLILYDLFNLRKKLEPYVSTNKIISNEPSITVSRYKLDLNLLSVVLENIVSDLDDADKSIRLKKVLKRFNDNNFNRYFIDNGYDEIYLSYKNKKLPVPIYINKFNDFYLIIAIQQIYLLDSSNHLKTIGNISSYDTTIKDIIDFGERYKLKDVILFSKFNNLKTKLIPYIN